MSLKPLTMLLAACSALAQDPVEVAPKYYKRVFENQRIRALRSTAGGAVGHHHPDSVVIDPATGAAAFQPAVTHTEDSSAPRLIIELKPGRPRSLHGRWYPLDPKFFSIGLDNDQVRVTRVRIPEDSSTPQQNYLARLVIFLSPGRVVFRSPETGRRGERGSSGDLVWFEAGPQRIDNEDDPVEIAIVELK